MAVTIDDGVVRHRIQDMDIPEVDFGTFLWNTCKQYGNRVAVTVADGTSCSYGQLCEQWLRVADALEWLGFGPGQRACVYAANSQNLVFAIGGLLCAGGSIVFSKTVITTREFRKEVEETCPSLVFCDVDSSEKCQEMVGVVPSLKHVIVFGEVEGLISFTKLLMDARPLECRAPRGADADTVMGAFNTSGTTGVAKRVAISHRQWIAQLLATRELADGQIGPKDLVLCASALTHISGFWLFCGCLAMGVPLLMLPSFDAALLVPAVQKHRVTTIMTFPFYLRNLIDNAPSEAFESVDKVFIGGSPAPASLLLEAQDKFGFKFISQGYGLTETCASVTSTGLKSSGFGSVGKPVPMAQLKVTDPSTGKKLDAGQKGEICVKAPFTFMGYMNKPEETATAFDDEGFVRTEELPNHAHLHGGIEFVDHIPKSETGKNIRTGFMDALFQRRCYEPLKPAYPPEVHMTRMH
ncbi:hypothetical protein HPB50_002896 [Hyalomma asiaticum]|uniref:Uncharacterized protein n=1 Tax=Hyalomma asiaticum TaxID=266040 RepID=A0ACB7TDY0_HYAAI|nr:hypothetical protein HPB50_002896 [Hyalomma asiaticum]